MTVLFLGSFKNVFEAIKIFFEKKQSSTALEHFCDSQTDHKEI